MVGAFGNAAYRRVEAGIPAVIVMTEAARSATRSMPEATSGKGHQKAQARAPKKVGEIAKAKAGTLSRRGKLSGADDR